MLVTIVTAAILLGVAPLGSQAAQCVPSLQDYTQTVDNLSNFTSFLDAYAQVGFDPSTTIGYTAFAPTDTAWAHLINIISSNITGGGKSSGTTTQEADILLSIGFYHLSKQPYRVSQLLQLGSVQTALGDYTGYNVPLFFASTNGQAQVEGVPFDNVAPLPNVTMVCNTSLYVIDEVMLPSSSISNIPGFTSIVAADGPAGAPLPSNDIFNLPLPPDTEGIPVTATGAGGPVEGPNSINGASASSNSSGSVQTAADAVSAGDTAPVPSSASSGPPAAPAPQAARLSVDGTSPSLLAAAAAAAVGAMALLHGW